MDPGSVEARLRARLGDALEARLTDAGREFAGLLDRPALLLLVADEEGLLPAQERLELFPDEGPALTDLRGTVERIVPTRPFRRADGTTGFVCDVEVRTPGGVRRVVLWDQAVRAIQGWQGRAATLTALAPRGEAGRELHSTRATEVRPG